MPLAFYLLRAFWKPLALVMIAGMIFTAGYSQAKRACKAASLAAEIAELKRQAEAVNSVLERAGEESQARIEKIEILTGKVEAYELAIGENGACPLSDDDARRLRLIQ